jgi:hypothetical protein
MRVQMNSFASGYETILDYGVGHKLPDYVTRMEIFD